MHAKSLVQSSVLLCALLVSAVSSADPPPATPTPHPRTLADYAAGRRLEATTVRDGRGRITITNGTLRTVAVDGALTRAAGPAGGPQEFNWPTPVDPRLKRRWQAAVERRRRIVTRLEAKRAALEAELSRVRDARPTTRTVAREDGLRNRIRSLDHELATARAALARVQREARCEGAEPGWFRGS